MGTAGHEPESPANDASPQPAGPQQAISRRKTTLINIAFGYTQFGLSIVTGIVLVPIYLKFIPVGLYGAWLATGSVVIWLTVFDPGMANLLTQRVAAAYGRKDLTNVGELLTAGTVITISVASLLFGMGCLARPHVTTWLHIPAEDAPLIRDAFLIAVGTTALMVMYYTINAVNYGLQSSLAIGSIFLTATLCKIAMILVLLFTGTGLLALPYGEMTSAGILILLSSVLIHRNFRRHGIKYVFRLTGLRNLMGLFLYTFAARLSKIGTRSLDNFLISRYLGQECVVAYSLTGRAPRSSENLLGLPIAGFRPALAHVAGSGDEAKARAVIARLLRILIWCLGLATSGLVALNAGFVRLWVGEEHFAGSDVNLLICLGFLVNVWTNATSMLLFSMGGIKKNSLANIVSAISVVPLMYIGVKLFGLPGLILGNILSLLFISAWYFPFALLRIAKFGREETTALAKEFLLVSVVAVSVAIGFRQLSANGWSAFVLMASGLSIAYAVLITAVSGSFRMELGHLSRLVARRLRLKK